MVKAILDATLGVVDLGQTLDTHPDQDIGIFVGQLHNLLGVVTIGTQFKKS